MPTLEVIPALEITRQTAWCAAHPNATKWHSSRMLPHISIHENSCGVKLPSTCRTPVFCNRGRAMPVPIFLDIDTHLAIRKGKTCCAKPTNQANRRNLNYKRGFQIVRLSSPPKVAKSLLLCHQIRNVWLRWPRYTQRQKLTFQNTNWKQPKVVEARLRRIRPQIRKRLWRFSWSSWFGWSSSWRWDRRRAFCKKRTNVNLSSPNCEVFNRVLPIPTLCKQAKTMGYFLSTCNWTGWRNV